MFALSHPGQAEVRGRVERWKATFLVDLEQPSRCWIESIIDAGSLVTGDAERDGRARSAAFLDVARFPEISFRSTQISAQDGDRILTITGDLTIRKVTREVRVVIERERDGTLWEHPSKLAFRGHLSIRRQEFGLRWPGEQGKQGEQGEIEGYDLPAADLVDVGLRINARRGPK